MLKIALLGSPQIQRDDQTIDQFASQKSLALLCYLVLNPAMQQREFLAGLLWPDLPNRNAMTTLRNALANLNKLVGAHLTITRQQAGFHRAAPYWLDVEEVESILTPDVIVRAPHTWRQAQVLYRNDLLTGFSVREAEPFEEWLTIERERRRTAYLQGLLAAGAALAARSDAVEGLALADHILELEPWNEPAQQLVLSLLAQSGRRGEAIERYRQFSTLLDEEFGLEPTAELTHLFQRMVSLSEPIPTNLPPEQDGFVNRLDEIATLRTHINHPTTRLITLLGPGGSGKSRLAQHVARLFLNPTLSDLTFRDGIYEVFLENINETSLDDGHVTLLNRQDSITTAIANAINLPLRGGAAARSQLIAHLQHKTMLLILDNFEHLLPIDDFAAPQLLVDILARSPNLTMIVTSRERLNLRREWLLVLDGLGVQAVHTQEAVPGAGRQIDHTRTEIGRAISAAAGPLLFAERAKKVRPDFTLNRTNTATVTSICQLLEGMPLAIELAASWLRILGCDEIEQEIRHNLDFLNSPARDVPARHRSIRAVFNLSWQMLDPDEQAVLRKLSVIRGPFSREAAQAIADAHLPMLLSLVDKSWIRYRQPHDYSLHSLMRQYVQELRLAQPDEDNAAYHAYSAYYAQMTAHLLPQLRGEQLTAIDTIDQQRENIRSAWIWSLQHNHLRHIEQMFEAVFYYFVAIGQYQEGANAFARTAHQFERIGQPELQAIHLTMAGSFYAYLGDFAQAQEVLQHSKRLLDATATHRARSRAFWHQIDGRIHLLTGQYKAGAVALQHARNAYARDHEALGDTYCHYYLCMAAFLQQDLTLAKTESESVFTKFREHNHPLGMGMTLNLLGVVALHQEELAAAERYFTESLATFNELGKNPRMVEPLCSLSWLALRRNQLQLAQEKAEQALLEGWKSQIPLLLLQALGQAARTSLAMGNHSQGAEIIQVILADTACSAALHQAMTELEQEMAAQSVEHEDESCQEADASSQPDTPRAPHHNRAPLLTSAEMAQRLLEQNTLVPHR